MTLSELQAKREEVLGRLGVAREQFGERSVQYEDAAKTLAVLDGEIGKAEALTSGQNKRRSSYATFRND